MKHKIEENIDNVLKYVFVPELGNIKSGKVRDCHFLDDKLYMFASDRISCFDVILNQCIPYKGQVLNGVSKYFFENLPNGVNHVVKDLSDEIDPSLMLVDNCTPVKIEMVVRNYMTGSMWRAYDKGKRVFSGVNVKDGFKEYDQLENLFINPTSKADVGHDEEITENDCIHVIADQFGMLDSDAEEVYDKLKKNALAIFKKGMTVADNGGLLLVDTKYEFGLTKAGSIVLIDEIHTPDSSRYWLKSEYNKGKPQDWSKEFVRQYLIDKGFMGDGITPDLAKEVILETSRRYIDIYERLTKKNFVYHDSPIEERVVNNLKRKDHIQGLSAVIMMGSYNDVEHCRKIKAELNEYGIPSVMRVGSAHRTPEHVEETIDFYNKSIEPMALVSVAGGTDALSGTLAALSKHLVVSCPPYNLKPRNLSSCLNNPKGGSNVVVPKRENAAKAIAQHFSFDKKISKKLLNDIEAKKVEVLESDKKLNKNK